MDIHLPGTDLGASLVLEICWSKEASGEEEEEEEELDSTVYLSKYEYYGRTPCP